MSEASIGGAAEPESLAYELTRRQAVVKQVERAWPMGIDEGNRKIRVNRPACCNNAG